MDLNLSAIKKGAIFVVILWLVFGFSNSVLAQNSPGKIFPARIDPEAAFAVREEGVIKEINCNQWPEKFWVFLFGAYLFLLVFNLSFGLKEKKRQWFWELLLTLLALWTWKKLDACEMQRWFYYCVLESGIIIYGFYLYSFLLPDKKED